jgi:hypothetical protein
MNSFFLLTKFLMNVRRKKTVTTTHLPTSKLLGFGLPSLIKILKVGDKYTYRPP